MAFLQLASNLGLLASPFGHPSRLSTQVRVSKLASMFGQSLRSKRSSESQSLNSLILEII